MFGRETYEVEGFLFFDEKTAGQAKKEAEGIKYLKSKMNLEKPETVLQVYNQMIDKEFFETVVGQQFLKELQEYLVTIPFIKNEDIRPIPIVPFMAVENAEKQKKNEQKKRKAREQKQAEDAEKKSRKQKSKEQEEREIKVYHVNFKRKFHRSIYLNLVLVAIIIAMFTISLISTNNVTILNYENQLINKYEDWQQQLDEREQELDAREAKLNQGQ